MTFPVEIATPPEPLAYATATSDGPALAALQPALSKFLGVAILSGMCVGSCFLLMASHVLGGLLHMAVYAAILTLAVRGSVELAKVGFQRAGWLTLDTAAGIGLVMIGLTPVGLWIAPGEIFDSHAGGILLAAAFALLAFTSARHREFYARLSYPVRAAGYRKTAIWLRCLGWFKAIFETLWLICCAIPLAVLGFSFRTGPGQENVLIWVALGGLFGCFVYAPVWVTMIVLHARVLRLSKIREPAGFEVLMAQPVIQPVV